MSVLEIARSKVSFDINKLSPIIWETQERLDGFLRFSEFLAKDPILKNNPKDFQISIAEIYELLAKKAEHILENAEVKDINEFATLNFPEADFQFFIINQLVSSLNFEMFLRTIINLGTLEQVKLVQEPAGKCEIQEFYLVILELHLDTTQRIMDSQDSIIQSPKNQPYWWWSVHQNRR